MAHRTRTGTKHWNTDMETVKADETVYTDYKDEQHIEACDLKFKTVNDRLHLWIEAHRTFYAGSNAEWEALEHQTTMRLSDSRGKLAITFHKSKHKFANVVLVQGSLMHSWRDDAFPGLLMLVNHGVDIDQSRDQLTNPTYHDGLEDYDPENFQSVDYNDNEKGKTNSSLVFVNDTQDDSSEEDEVSDEEEEEIKEENPEVEPENKTLSKKDVNADDKNSEVSDADISILHDNQILETIQSSYVKLCDRSNTAISDFSRELNEVRKDIGKLPNKIMAMVKKELSEHAENQATTERLKGEAEAHRKTFQQLMTENEQKSSEIWRLNSDLSKMRSVFRSQQQQQPQQQQPQPPHQPSPHQPPLRLSTPQMLPTRLPPPQPLRQPPQMSPQQQQPRGAHPPAAGTSPSHAPTTQTSVEYRPSNATHTQHTVGVNANLTHTPTRTEYPAREMLTSPNITETHAGAQSTSSRTHRDVIDVSRRRETYLLSRGPMATVDDDDVSEAESVGSYEHDRPQRLKMKIRDAAETVIIGDSTPKHIQSKRYMGRTPAYVQKASTSTVALDILESWKPSKIVKYAVIHVGVNDIRSDVPVDDITNNLQASMDAMNTIFPDACIAYSEVLYIGRGDRESQMNKNIKEVNSLMFRFTRNRNYVYVNHATLQATQCRLFDDEVHINSDGGTAVLVSDIYKAFRWRAQRENANTDTDTERVFYNRKYDQREGRRSDVRTRQHRSHKNYTTSGNNGRSADMDSMIQLLTLNMLRNFKVDA